MEEQIRLTSRRYGPVLDKWQAWAEQELGPLLWDPRQDTELIRGQRVRVGPVIGRGVALSALDLDAVEASLNEFLRTCEFETSRLVARPNGELLLTSTDRRAAELSVRMRSTIEAWVIRQVEA